jgi:ribosomal protein L29
MSNELPKQKPTSRTLEERFAQRPRTYRRLQEIADAMDHAIANGTTADEAEAMAIEQIQKLGGELLQDWAEAKQQQALTQAQADHPQSIKHIKKK